MKTKSRQSPKSKRTSKAGSNLPEIVPVAEIDNPQSSVIYGPAGTGKTTLACTWPGPILLVDMNDRGTDSVSDIKGLDVARCETIGHVEALYWELAEGRLDYETVVLDTVTRLQQLCIEDITGEEEVGWGTLSRQDFGKVSSRMKRLIVDYRDLDVNTVFLAQQRFFNINEEDEEAGDLAEIGPALMPSIATELNAAVNIIGQTFIRRKVESKKIGKRIIHKDIAEYCLRVGPNAVIRTKIRKPKSVVLPNFLIDPTYKDLIAIISGGE